MCSRGGMNSCWSGRAGRLQSRILRMMPLCKNGVRTGVYRFIAGRKCVQTSSRGGASACAQSDLSFISFGSITCLGFIVSMPFPGGRGRTTISSRSIGIRCWNKPAAGRHISFRGTITPGNKYERLSVATNATHDHKPVRALWEEVFEHQTATSEQSRFDLAKIAVFAGFQPTIDQIQFEKDFYPAIMEALFKSESWL